MFADVFSECDGMPMSSLVRALRSSFQDDAFGDLSHSREIALFFRKRKVLSCFKSGVFSYQAGAYDFRCSGRSRGEFIV